ncbi:autotransporter family protein [Campylobacter vicugnae]|uniref:autotransporter family protein n=1 Tax=Campylobacter vicugnae TaxID=1660076 RepID=UPI002550FF47|nr:autotransporter outer membrane beta-barrel domain-containing protein [Campylobacter ovis]MDL0095037.1 autotransporter outer membrane beta-barrel domain-containing protein [Campylobacter ovis]
MVKIKLSALACAILVGGGQLVAEDVNDIDLGNYSYYQPVDINQETKTIIGDATDVIINVDNNGELISRVPIFVGAGINITNNSNAIFESEVSEVYIEHPYLHIINNSTAVFNENLEIRGDSSPVIEQDNDFRGGSLSLDNNSTLDIKGEAEFILTDALINHGSTAKIDNLVDYGSKIYVVNDSKLEINKNAEFYDGTHLIVKDDSNATINGALAVYNSGTIEFVDGEFVVNDGGIKIAQSNLNVEGEATFGNSDTELNNSSIANFKDKLTLIDSAMLLKNGSTLDVGGVADFEDSALVVQNGSKVVFGNNFTMKNGEVEKSIIILDNGSEINIKGDFENHGVIYYGASADSAPKITVEGKTTLKDTTEIGIYATSGDISNLTQAVFLESKGAIENKVADENIYAMYFDPDNEDANEEGLVKYDQNIIDAALKLSKDGKKLLVQILMSDDIKNKLINEKIDFIAKSTQTAGVNLTAQDLDIITSLFTIEDAKGNGLVATEGTKLAAQASQGNQEAAQIISKTAQSIQKNSQDSINATSNLINTFNLATKNEVGKRISNVTTRSNASQLANFIESLEGQKFADASNGVLLSMMADEMAAYQNSFYLNALGAKGDFKDGTNPKIYGAILGYDRMIDDLLIGGYFSYTNSETENIELDSDIYELGLYSRYFLDNNEFSFNIAGGYGKNDLSYTQNIFGINKILQSNFNSSYIALGLDYGYRFAINDNANIKPYIGADYLYSKTQNYTLKDETGADFQNMQSNTVKNLKANLGLEMVKSFDEISIYADAKIKRDLINDEGITRSSFAGSSAGFNIKGNDKKHTNFAIDTGIVYNATKNLSINLNLGADVNSDDKIYSTSFGAAYKF